MARILCNVAGGGKPLKGNAETGDVLAGKTFSNKQSNALTGSMPNNGALNITLTPSGNNSTSQAVAAGYYSGGTIKANGSSSYSKGVSDADGRVNTSSSSYSKGVSDADGRVNTSSASYNSGYAKGQNVKLSKQTYQAKPRGQSVSHSLSVPAGKHIIIGVITTSSNGAFSGSLSGASFTNLTSHLMNTYANQLYINAGVVSLRSATTITLNGTLNSDYAGNQNMNFAIIAIQIG